MRGVNETSTVNYLQGFFFHLIQSSGSFTWRSSTEYDLIVSLVNKSTNFVFRRSVFSIQLQTIRASTMSELVKVIVRCRPRNEKEEKMKCQVGWLSVMKNSRDLFFGNLNTRYLPNLGNRENRGVQTLLGKPFGQESTWKAIRIRQRVRWKLFEWNNLRWHLLLSCRKCLGRI